MSDELSVIYYPYATPRSIDKIKKALLLFDHIYFILPSYAYKRLGIERASTSPEDSFRELYYEMNEPVNANIFRIIEPAQNAVEFSEEMIQSLIEDEADRQFMQESHNQADWWLYPEKVPSGLDRVFYNERLRKYEGERMFKLPFAVGESLMISHAIYACIYQEKKYNETLTPMTDEPVHQRLLRRRLERGIHNREQKTGSKVPKVNREGFDIAALPVPSGNIQEIIDKKNDHQSSVMKLRASFKKLSQLLQTKIGQSDFTSMYVAIMDEIKNSYADIGLVNIPDKIVSFRKDEINPHVIGDPAAIIGMTLDYDISNAAITSVDTNFSTRLLNENSRISNPSITYELAVK